MKNEAHPLLEMPEQTASFSGYRPHKLPKSCTADVQRDLSLLLKKTICESYAKGYRVFVNGMMSGWDILAGEAVLALRANYSDMRCISVAPFKKQYFVNENWTPEWKRRALIVYCQSDFSFYLSEQYKRGTYYTRNRYLVDHSSLLIAYYDGKPGGTKHTCDYASKQGLDIVNIAIDYCGYTQ